jgi:hypothetical protein
MRDVADELFMADVPIVITNTAISGHIYRFTRLEEDNPCFNANLLHAIVTCQSASVGEALTRELTEFPEDRPWPVPKLALVEPALALSAIESLARDPSSPQTVQKYQYDTIQSGISQVTAAVKDSLSMTGRPAEEALGWIKLRTALSQLRGAFSVCRSEIDDRGPADFHKLWDFRDIQPMVQDSRAVAQKTLGDNGALLQTITGAMPMHDLLHSLSYWRLVSQVDQISGIVSNALRLEWCKSLEQQLVLLAGRLLVSQEKVTEKALHAASVSPGAEGRWKQFSAVLENDVKQMATAPNYALTPESLTTPIRARRQQLLAYTTSRLQVDAQQVAVVTMGSVVGGFGSVALLQLFGLITTGLETGTAVGGGAFIMLLGVRWAMGRWEKAKSRWLEDLRRVEDALSRDIPVSPILVLLQFMHGVECLP